VGYPLDLVVCTALGVDLFDCVYPTRTARFGVALVPGKAPGILRLKGNDCATAEAVIQDDCPCQACRRGMSRATLARLFKAGNPVAVELLTQHNIAYMMALVRDMRQSILNDRFAEYARNFIWTQYPGNQDDGDDIPDWVLDAMQAAGVDLSRPSRTS
jgi:queuine tRNA-ribosyltransferase catalytic subunit